MDPKTKAQIFDPFYTTKGVGKGTGLGLSTVYGIIKEHGGHVTCYSEPGIGTTFKIYLPVYDSVGAPAKAEKAPEEKIFQGHGAVLLVDDEEAIREFAKEILNRESLEVLTAASGEEALEIYKNSQEDIELVVLDLGMPGMGGRKCLEELLVINPQIKVLVASGYSPEEKTAKSQQPGAAGFIAKPFRRNELLDKVKNILDQ
jgi:CheY-like chemotaxis protein